VSKKPLSATIAALYLMEQGTSLCEVSSTRHRVLVHAMRSQRSECGSIIGFDFDRRVTLPEALDLDAWCYSCMGGALQFMEKGPVT
jgi:hypothetical protein